MVQGSSGRSSFSPSGWDSIYIQDHLCVLYDSLRRSRLGLSAGIDLELLSLTRHAELKIQIPVRMVNDT